MLVIRPGLPPADPPLKAKFLLFLRTLSTTADAREHARELSLKNVRLSVYSQLPSKWLAQVLLRLPGLQSLALSAFPLFDHAALLAVAPHSHTGLLTLCATACTNTTAPALTHLLARLPYLVNLDLSGTSGASHPSVLAHIATLRCLRCLSLRSLRIDDAALAPLVRGLGTQLWKLDLGGNLLTDKTVGLLLDWSFAPPEYYTHTSACDDDAAPPPPPSSGLSHLRISANRISATGVQRLLKSTRLETLDVGAGSKDGVAGVAAALETYAWRNLRTLRVDSAIVFQGDWPSRVGALRTLVLCAVPVAASRRFADTLLGMMAALENSGVDVLEMEMDNVAVGLYSSSSGAVGARADFSFFSGNPEEGEGSSSWMGEGTDEAEVDVLTQVAEYRKRCRDTGSGWKGKVRVVKDLGGRGSIERGIGDESWGIVREKM